jgi:diguanylate cyclase (GGDEF)-like protein/PAS domain S-box-containing protein
VADAAAIEAAIRATFDSAPDGMVLLAADGGLLASNPRFLQLWNFPPDMLARADPVEMRAHTAAQLSDPKAYLDSIDSLLATQQAQVLDEVRLLDGRVFERHVSPLVAEATPGGVVVRWRDVTLRDQAQRRLAQAQRRSQALFDNALSSILLADDQGRYLDANPAACELLGYTREELLTLSVADLVVPGTMDLQQSWSGFLEQRKSRGRVHLRRRDGQTLVAQFNAVAHMQPGVHLSILSDVTEDVATLQRLQELSTLLELAMMGADLAYWDVDLQTATTRSVNGQWHQMLGYAPGEIGSGMQHWYELVHPEDRAARQAAWDAHVRGQTERYECEFRMRHKAGHWVWVLARGRAVARDAQGLATRVVGTRMDISLQKTTEERLTEQAHTDGLTGVLNRRRFLEVAGAELARSARLGQPVALLMVDLDHFKSVNDRLGHAAGDEVLRVFAGLTRDVMRDRDLVGRLGGEEFGVLLAGTGVDGALSLAQRLLQRVRGHEVSVGEQRIGFTVSVGVAAQRTGDTIEALLERADRALYRAKAQGRDRALLAADDDPAHQP